MGRKLAENLGLHSKKVPKTVAKHKNRAKREENLPRL